MYTTDKIIEAEWNVVLEISEGKLLAKSLTQKIVSACRAADIKSRDLKIANPEQRGAMFLRYKSEREKTMTDFDAMPVVFEPEMKDDPYIAPEQKVTVAGVPLSVAHQAVIAFAQEFNHRVDRREAEPEGVLGHRVEGYHRHRPLFVRDDWHNLTMTLKLGIDK